GFGVGVKLLGFEFEVQIATKGIHHSRPRAAEVGGILTGDAAEVKAETLGDAENPWFRIAKAVIIDDITERRGDAIGARQVDEILDLFARRHSYILTFLAR